MATLSFKVNAEEEAAIRYRMRQGGENNLSEYLRRNCTGGGNDHGAALGRLQKQVDQLTEAVQQSQYLLKQMIGARTDNLELQLLAGLYMLLHPSVERAVQATVAGYLDLDAIENILRDTPARDRLRKPR